MKKLTLIFTLLFSTVMFPSSSYAKWVKVSETVSGDSFYVNTERLKIKGKYRYVWRMVNYSRGKSSLSFSLVDCDMGRKKDLKDIEFSKPMGEGTPLDFSEDDPKWDYPIPDTSIGIVIDFICKM